MQRFRRPVPRLAALIVVLAAVIVGSASGSIGVRPPRGIPDLSKMALRVSDLPPGATVKKQGYVETSSVAEYDREFSQRTVRIGRKRLLALESDVFLEVSALSASAQFVELRRALGKKSARKAIADSLKKEIGVGADSVRVSLPFRFGAGQESVGLTITIGTFLGMLQAELGWFRVDRVVEVLALAGPLDVKLSHADIARLARPASAHMVDGLVPIASVLPAVGGNATAGQTLTGTAGTWTNGPVRFAYQWQRCDGSGGNCVDIAGATSPGYVLLDDDVGTTVRLRVTAANAVGSTTKVSAPTAAVASLAGAPANVTPPSISGTASQGQTLTAATGVWVGKPTGFTYQWQRCDTGGGNCVSIDGATVATYVVTPGDAGSTLRVAVTAANASGSTSAVSPPTGTVV